MVSIAMARALQLRGVRKRFLAGVSGCLASADVLRGIDLDLDTGESVAVVGAPGSGKSTLLLCAAGLLRSDAGTIAWFDDSAPFSAATRTHYAFSISELTPSAPGPEGRVYLLDLPPVLDAALKTGRCRSPRTLYELSRLHVDRPERVAELVTGSRPVTRVAVAEIRDAAPVASEPLRAATPTISRTDRTAQTLTRVNGLCQRLEMALLRLTRTAIDIIPPDDLAALRQRVTALADRLGA